MSIGDLVRGPLWVGTAVVMVAGLAPAVARAATMHGTVRAAGSGAPLVGARIMAHVKDAPGRPRIWRTETDADGKYTLSSLPAATYEVRVTHPDYATLERTVTVPDAGLVSDFELSGNTVPRAEVVEVQERAVARETPAAFSNLSRQDLEERAGIKDLPILMSELPSTTWYSENGNGVGYNYLTLRGFDQTRISVMIDGVPQNDPEDHNVYWANFFDLAGSLEDVQVQRGAGAGFYGPPSIGGSINLVTRQLSPEPHLRLEAGYGSFDTRRLTGEVNSGLLADHWVVYGRFSYLQSDGYRDWSWSKFWRGFVGVAWYGERSSIKLQAYGGPQNDALAYYGIPKEYNEDETLRRTNYGAPADGRTGDVEAFNQVHVDLIHDWTPTPTLAVKNTLFFLSGTGYFDFDGSWGDPTYFQLCTWTDSGVVGDYPQYCLDPSEADYQAIPADTMIRAYVGNKQAGWLPRVTLQQRGWGELTLGAELRAHRSSHWGRIQAGSDYPSDVVGDADRHIYEYRGGKNVVSTYANERVTLGRTRLEANVQAVYLGYALYDEQEVLSYGTNTGGNDLRQQYTFLNPRAGVNVNLTDAVNAFVSIGQTSREPRLKELYDAENVAWGAVPDLDAVVPERLTDLEVGGHLEGTRFRVTAGGFFMDFRNEIVKTGGLDQYGQPYYGNAERTRHVGLELEAAVRPLLGLDLAGNLTLSRNRFVAFDEEVETVDEAGEPVVAAVDRAGNPIAGSPDFIANARLSYRVRGVLASLDLKYVGLQYTDNAGEGADEATLPGGSTVALEAGYDNTVDPYSLVGASVAYRFPAATPLRGLTLAAEAQNLLNSKVLLTGHGEDDFFPAATRSVFLRAVYER